MEVIGRAAVWGTPTIPVFTCRRWVILSISSVTIPNSGWSRHGKVILTIRPQCSMWWWIGKPLQKYKRGFFKAITSAFDRRIAGNLKILNEENYQDVRNPNQVSAKCRFRAHRFTLLLCLLYWLGSQSYDMFIFLSHSRVVNVIPQASPKILPLLVTNLSTTKFMLLWLWCCAFWYTDAWITRKILLHVHSD
jgi:hypothetical protein